MAIQTVISCDVEGCDKKKDQVNHWFTAWIQQGTFKAYPNTLSALELAANEVKHVCGVEHAVVMFTRFLSHKTLDMNPK